MSEPFSFSFSKGHVDIKMKKHLKKTLPFGLILSLLSTNAFASSTVLFITPLGIIILIVILFFIFK